MNTRARPPLLAWDRACRELPKPAAAPLIGPRVDEDELVRIARARFTNTGLAEVAPDAAAHAPLRLLVVDYATLVETPVVGPEQPAISGGFGRVYVTSERLLHVGRGTLAVPLEDVCDAAVTSGRLLLVLRGGGGVALETPWPRLLRLQVGMARAGRAAALRAVGAGA